MPRATTMLAGSAVAVLALAGCANSADPAGDDAAATANAVTAGTCPSPAPAPPPGEVAVAQPQNQGQALFDAICAAQSSIDIVIYQIGAQDIQDALVAAMQRGVKVRIMMDGYSTSQVKYNGQFASALTQAAQQASVPAGALQINWSSDNFNITHQKSVIIDATDAAGQPIAASALPASARLLVSTGNFQQFRDTPFYGARDFYITTGDPSLIAEAAKVFASDFACDGPTTTNDLRSSTDLVWSNGTTGVYADQVGQYPPVDTGYFAPGKVTDPAPVVQGNSFDYQYGLINEAGSGDIVRIYNEEFTSTAFVDAVKAAVQRGADVRIVMSYEPPSAGKPTVSMANLSAMAASVPADSSLPGVSVTLYAPQTVVPDALYIHAKSILVNGADGTFKGGFVGSENLSNPSMDDNRELGLPLQASDDQVVSTIQSTFDDDFTATTNTAQWSKSDPSTVPPAWDSAAANAQSELDTADGSATALQRVGAPVGRCGPVTAG